MSNKQRSDETPRLTPSVPAGYVPAVGGADGQEDPAPEAVVTDLALPTATAPVGKPSSGPVRPL